MYCEEIMNQVTFYKQYKAFKEGKQSIVDEPREGRPSTTRTEVIKHIAARFLQEKRRITVRVSVLITRLHQEHYINKIWLYHGDEQPYVAHTLVI